MLGFGQRITQAFVVLLLLCLGALVIFYFWYQVNEDRFVLALATAALQIVVVVVLGTAVTLLAEEFNHQRRQAETRDEFRKKVLERLDRAYTDVKRARRLLRAQAFAPPYYPTYNEQAQVNLKQYDAHLLTLNDSQLELEQLIKDIAVNDSLFGDWRQIVDAIRVMEERLKNSVSEYEHERGNYDDSKLPTISELPELRDFVNPPSRSEIIGDLTNCYKKAARLLQRDILEPKER